MFTPEKLTALRARFAGAGGDEIHDPAFAEVARLIFKNGDRRPAP